MNHRRTIAAVTLAILVIIGVGVGVAGGSGVPGVPLGWVGVQNGDAVLYVPPNWHVIYNDPCAEQFSPGVIYVDTHTLPLALCAASFSTGPVLTFARPSGRVSGHWTSGDINGIPVLRGISDGYVDVVVPSLGVEMFGMGQGVDRIIGTLTTTPG